MVESSGVAVQSSGLLACEQSVAFGNVQVGAGYRASILAYDRTDVASGDPARWSGECDPITADHQALRYATNCRLNDSEASPMTRVLVVLDAATTGQECGAGGVARYELVLEDETISAACGETVTLERDSTESVEIQLLAYGDGEDSATLGGHCFARPALGATVAVTCEALQSEGGIEVPLETIAAALGASCDELRNLSVVLDGDPSAAIEVVRPDCEGSIHFSSVPPGEHELGASAVRGSEPRSASCSAEVQPGLVARPNCDAD
jgi:hypothetical protein